MYRNNKRTVAVVLSTALVISAIAAPVQLSENISPIVLQTVSAEDTAITIDDMPDDFKSAADWIWQNRIEREQSTARRNTIFDQIIAGKGTINYVVKWQSYRQLTYEQRQKFEKMLSDCINGWNDWLKGYENWCYDHIDVKIVGWAVIDKSCMLDLHDDEIVYTDTKFYDSQYDTSNGREEIPDKEPFAPSELSRFDHFLDTEYEYPGGLDKRFDMYMWATQGFPDIGGCGGDWGQRLSDTAYLNMIDGENLHVLEHEIGHGFGMPDFYGGEGESDGFPPGGFPGGENSLMMAGSAAKITDFDGWMLRYMWTKIKDEEGRFDIENNQPIVTEPPVTTTVTTSTVTATITTTATTTTTIATTATEMSTIPVTEEQTGFSDKVVKVEMFDENSDDGWYIQNGYIGSVWFENAGYYLLRDGYSTEDSTNLAYYEEGDVVNINFMFSYVPQADSELKSINHINSIELVQNVRETTAIQVTTLPATTTQTTSTESATGGDIKVTLLGDSNEDGNVNMADVTSIIQHIGNQDEYGLSAQGVVNAELCDNEKGITGMDAMAIQLLLANQTDKLPYIE